MLTDDDFVVYRVGELTTTNDQLRAELAEKQRAMSLLQATVSSLQSRLGSTALGMHETADKAACPLPVVVTTSAADQGHELVGDVFDRVAHQLVADSEELDVLGRTIDQVNSSVSLFRHFPPSLTFHCLLPLPLLLSSYHVTRFLSTSLCFFFSLFSPFFHLFSSFSAPSTKEVGMSKPCCRFCSGSATALTEHRHVLPPAEPL